MFYRAMLRRARYCHGKLSVTSVRYVMGVPAQCAQIGAKNNLASRIADIVRTKFVSLKSDTVSESIIQWVIMQIGAVLTFEREK